ncbi:MAG: hypothetical protein A2487_02820 [Candidatus Raymondbacteria bacterium RifOxyC12_full_50_8]|uniref:Uncharacterized protein n=1 Tax=Candidatus Raymondbacteria bacterium RIFOXYD12_FULL_49_13 TaxID=1817890 RepID=A0A1F7F6R3_UNCRA|nr:MAG: hypothetical protein A2350_07030 [Candidatus Raymondbacteria bacterium RifOxyB12_full_50_8]OGJ93175.1 MAG: hypothetical protein A2248_17535 [Candidatus Raymondbacteria bacterium RIFOXYA2_FULL_49_16]OGJ93375.1 MAG: hypothetical protein A2487_02820 [Candidatus Raymondbacteria bacterium RifOxyC12_full_50_8]OGK02283.1 MAG: hypothetical protein A2519_16555 [Candidatus Raymondbacteria bacterium RIFOXYD12_FULL_49_13]OGP44897.1 MAG: hypothetical protein A2324_19460 [Candidatus Raymondbacteria b
MADNNIPVTANGDVTIDCDNNNDQTTCKIVFSHDNGTELARIQENGCFGIGNTAPTYPLDVLKDGNSENIIANLKNINSGNSAGVALNLLAYNASTKITKFGAGHSTQASNMVINNVGGDIIFKWSGTEKLRITSDGKLKIGSWTIQG